jgi:DNA-binding NtrC family response regulator
MQRATHVFLGTPAVIASEPMQRILALAGRVARSEASVLITGESGSGKEMIARAIHDCSARAPKPWVDLNCAALPENLLESELFGYEKGAFSGADSSKPGLFELAHHGTIFLDEIGELDPRVQVKLLRVLDGAPYYRLGGVKKVTVDVRVVAATNADLGTAVEHGRFRNDLYHRLSQFTLEVPPLRERLDDIAPLAEYFLSQYHPEMTFSEGALRVMQRYGWPGNIRELRNVVMRAGIVNDGGEIQPGDLPLKRSFAAVPADEGDGLHSDREESLNGHDVPHSLESAERRLIFEALRVTGGHHQKAADRLGISRRTLSRKLKGYGANRETPLENLSQAEAVL